MSESQDSRMTIVAWSGDLDRVWPQLILATTGVRLSELRGLRLEDIEPDGLVLVRGKGARQRQVYLLPATLAELRGWTARRAGYVFAAYEKGTPSCYLGTLPAARTLWVIVRRIAARAGVEGCYPHRLRVTAANRFLRLGGDLGALQVLLGHADISMTAHYGGWTAKERALTMQRRLEVG